MLNSCKMNEPICAVIADDDATTRFVLRSMLQQNLVHVAGEAADGEKAVELCALFKPQVVFLDIDMPRLNGNQAAQKIRLLYPDIGIIMVSAVSTPDNVREALEAGATGFVVKPFSPIKLIGAMDNLRRKAR